MRQRRLSSIGLISLAALVLGVAGSGAAGPKITTPTGVHVVSIADRAVTLAWTASTSNTGTGKSVAYRVKNGTAIAAASMGTKVTVSSLKPATPYAFTVTAYDQDGNTSAASATVKATTTAQADSPYQKIAYYDQWSIYGDGFMPKMLVTRGMASRLTTLVYDFQNIHPTNLTCFEAIKQGTDGGADAWADYLRPFGVAESVDGSADTWSQPLKGIMNQLRELKVRYPRLRILVSIGGWTYSKYFSDAALTDASRKKLVSSCIAMFLKGNLPTGVSGDPAGGPAAAAGIFDGFDVDWEYPGVMGNDGNHVRSVDGANFTLLMKEFRNQLDAYGATVGKRFLLTGAVPAGGDKIAKFEIAKLPSAMDWIDVMTYDMHGSWDSMTNFQSALYPSSADPSKALNLSVDQVTKRWIQGGFPARRVMIGIPLYARGWTGVTAGAKHGLYRSAAGPSPSFPYSQSPGLAYWKELKVAGKTSSFFYDSVTKSYWIYDGTSFYTLDPPASIALKDQYVKAKGLGGVMMFSLLDDDANATLVKAVAAGL